MRKQWQWRWSEKGGWLCRLSIHPDYQQEISAVQRRIENENRESQTDNGSRQSQTDRQLEQTESDRQTMRADRVRQKDNESRQSQTDRQWEQPESDRQTMRADRVRQTGNENIESLSDRQWEQTESDRQAMKAERVWQTDKENTIQSMWLETAFPANQHPKSTTRKTKSPQTPTHLMHFLNKCVGHVWEKNNFSHTVAAWFAFRTLFSWSPRTTCTKDHGLFYLNWPQINEVGKSNHIIEGAWSFSLYGF